MLGPPPRRQNPWLPPLHRSGFFTSPRPTPPLPPQLGETPGCTHSHLSPPHSPRDGQLTPTTATSPHTVEETQLPATPRALRPVVVLQAMVHRPQSPADAPEDLQSSDQDQDRFLMSFEELQSPVRPHTFTTLCKVTKHLYSKHKLID